MHCPMKYNHSLSKISVRLVTEMCWVFAIRIRINQIVHVSRTSIIYNNGENGIRFQLYGSIDTREIRDDSATEDSSKKTSSLRGTRSSRFRQGEIGGLTVWWFHLYIAKSKSYLFFEACVDIVSCVLRPASGFFRFFGYSIFMFHLVSIGRRFQFGSYIYYCSHDILSLIFSGLH